MPVDHRRLKRLLRLFESIQKTGDAEAIAAAADVEIFLHEGAPLTFRGPLKRRPKARAASIRKKGAR